MDDNTIPDNPNMSKSEALKIISTFTWAYDHTDNDDRVYHGSNGTYECILYAQETMYHQHISSQLHLAYKGDMLCGKLNIAEYDDQNQSCIEVWKMIPQTEKCKTDRPYDEYIPIIQKDEIAAEPLKPKKAKKNLQKGQQRKEYNDVLQTLKTGQICSKWPSIKSAIASIFYLHKDDLNFLELIACIILHTNKYDDDQFKMNMKRRLRNSEIIFGYDCGNVNIIYNKNN